MTDLFSAAAEERLRDQAPLAARLRPRTLDDVVGQEHLVGPGKALRRLVEHDRLRAQRGSPGVHAVGHDDRRGHGRLATGTRAWSLGQRRRRGKCEKEDVRQDRDSAHGFECTSRPHGSGTSNHADSRT